MTNLLLEELLLFTLPRLCSLLLQFLEKANETGTSKVYKNDWRFQNFDEDFVLALLTIKIVAHLLELLLDHLNGLVAPARKLAHANAMNQVLFAQVCYLFLSMVQKRVPLHGQQRFLQFLNRLQINLIESIVQCRIIVSLVIKNHIDKAVFGQHAQD